MNIRLQAEKLSLTFGSHRVLNGVNVSVERGKTLAILGRSGCGKSSLLRALSTLDPIQDGNAYLDGQQYLNDGALLFEPWEIRQNIAMVFQEFNLFPNLTVLRNITLALEKTKHMPTEEANGLAVQIAKNLHIDDLLKRYPNTISGGQAQRVALARAMVLRPKVLLLDEITSALDPETILNVVAAIRELRESDTNHELSIILVTHLMKFAAEFADRIAFMHEGVFLEELPAKEFSLKCTHPQTKEFVAAHSLPL